MLLAIDTATRWTGIALHDGLNIVAETGWVTSDQHEQKVDLAPTVNDLLRKTSLMPADLSGIAITTGPGAYGCLRAGLSFAKGMALAYNVPLLGVSTLDIAVAAFEQSEAYLIVVAEVGHDQVSAATYRWYSRKGWQVKREPMIYTWKELLRRTREGSRFTGELSAESQKKIRSADKGFGIVKGAANTRRAGYLAELGQIALRKNNRLDASAIVPTYLREPKIIYNTEKAPNLTAELTLNDLPPTVYDNTLLAIDTATRWTGIALYNGDNVIAEIGWRAANTQTIELAPTVDNLLRKTSVSAENLKGIAVAIGPGSYTGLRIGLGFAKGMALVHGTPVVGVPTLDILVAAQDEAETHLVVVVEAGRRRISAATYRWYSRKGWQLKHESANYDWDTLLDLVKEGSCFTGEISADARKKIRSADKGFNVLKGAENVRRAGYLAELGQAALQKEAMPDAAAVTPVYQQKPGGA